MTAPPALTACHTADLAAADLAAVRALLDAAFPDDFDDDDFEHGLGGWHALVHDGDRLVAHGSVVRRQFLLAGRPLPVGYVENVAVAATHRRRGLGGLVMAELERVVAAGHGVGFLGASDDGAALYAVRGWPVWRGPLSVLTPAGVRRTPDEDGGVRVFDPAGTLDLDADLVCEWRAGDVW
ncbi:GNAT family N-acetyltransferase [Kineococcus sp. SYSU DK001]|uniref:GNAT family N-acetyltransferase n=1 Tax=Kineococcus sp. SYSU DK001 TaxID=3383122 RepID=UPI003D7E428D